MFRNSENCLEILENGLKILNFFAAMAQQPPAQQPPAAQLYVVPEHCTCLSAVCGTTLGTVRARTPRHYMPLDDRWVPKYVIQYLINVNILLYFSSHWLAITFSWASYAQQDFFRWRGWWRGTWCGARFIHRTATRGSGSTTALSAHYSTGGTQRHTRSISPGGRWRWLCRTWLCCLGYRVEARRWGRGTSPRRGVRICLTGSRRNDHAVEPVVPFSHVHGPTPSWLQQYSVRIPETWRQDLY